MFQIKKCKTKTTTTKKKGDSNLKTQIPRKYAKYQLLLKLSRNTSNIQNFRERKKKFIFVFPFRTVAIM